MRKDRTRGEVSRNHLFTKEGSKNCRIPMACTVVQIADGESKRPSTQTTNYYIAACNFRRGRYPNTKATPVMKLFATRKQV